MEKFSYDVCYSAPALSPVDVFLVEFISESGTLSASFSNGSNCGMGNGSNCMAGSQDHKYFLPKAIEVLWVSVVDRKVYSIVARLPYDELVSMFKAYKGLNRLDLCLLPEGKIILYVKGIGYKFLLNWMASAFEEVNDELLEYIYRSRASNSMKEYYDAVYTPENEENLLWLDYLNEKGSTFVLIRRYLQRFNYEMNFEFEDNTTNNFEIWTKYVNQEVLTKGNQGLIKSPARIKELRAEWDINVFHYTCIMYFNEDEILDVFDEAYGDDSMQKGELKIKVGRDNNLFDISLNVGDKSIKLEKTEIRVFQDPIKDYKGDGPLYYKNYDGNHRNLFIDDKEYYQEH